MKHIFISLDMYLELTILIEIHVNIYSFLLKNYTMIIYSEIYYSRIHILCSEFIISGVYVHQLFT